MVCKNCGKILKKEEKFCTVCGCYNEWNEDTEEENEVKEEALEEDEEPVEVVEVSLKNTIPHSEDISSEDREYSLFIGEDYKWVAQRPFNVYAFFFSWIYFLYRKVYSIGIIGLVITGLVIRLIPILIIPHIILSMLFSGFLFNKVYLKIVEKRINRINNMYGDSENIDKILRKTGGVSVWSALLIFLLFLCILVISYLNIFSLHKESKFSLENSNNLANCKSIGAQVYRSLESYQITGSLKEAACIVKVGVKKEYEIYFIVAQEEKDKYVSFETKDGLVYIKGNTAMIGTLEGVKGQYGLAESDEEFLTNSKSLKNKYSTIREDSDREDKLIMQRKDKKEKTHFIIGKDDIIG